MTADLLTYPLCHQATCKPVTQLMQQEMKTLKDSAVSDSVVLHILASMGLNYHGILYKTIEYIPVLRDFSHTNANSNSTLK